MITMERDSYTDDEIRNFLSLKKVAVIGISRSESKAAHFVPKYLSENGFDIIPVNPNSNEILSKSSPTDTSTRILFIKFYSVLSC